MLWKWKSNLYSVGLVGINTYFGYIKSCRGIVQCMYQLGGGGGSGGD